MPCDRASNSLSFHHHSYSRATILSAMSSIRPSNASLASTAKVIGPRANAGTFSPHISASTTLDLASNRASTTPIPSKSRQGETPISRIEQTEEYIIFHTPDGESDDFLTKYRDDTLARYHPKPLPPPDNRPKMQLQSACVPKVGAPEKVVRVQKRMGTKFAVNRNVKRRRLLDGEAEGRQAD